MTHRSQGVPVPRVRSPVRRAGSSLYHSSGSGVWAFGRHNDDTTSTSFTAVYGAKAVAGKRTHPVGVFDADAGRLLLYVNGRLSATKAYTGTDWNAVGPVQFGRRLYQGAYGEYADGRLSDVRLYPTALPRPTRQHRSATRPSPSSTERTRPGLRPRR
ncbi:LamG-like jellyroll fold domain-containing protein [Streptomyces mirabilis]|uniref:LamG-like jellyroll fold domain-containing protein n=1 Tax=Streptomyces mirabilis TaxID=68239 RepID=UPI00225468A8|nr:LamG-like jellyroll fold domain-containing protein [Streptomyces mirabilis]MCX4608865.1 LamG domain-containing protein [Streptomyces mirabilis]